MSSFSIKKLETTEPLNLYSDLNKSIEFGEGMQLQRKNMTYTEKFIT